MKITMKNGDLIEGTATELSNYIKNIKTLTPGAPPTIRPKSKQPSHTRRRYSRYELAVMARLANEGHSNTYIAQKLFRDNISPAQRTPKAIMTALRRLVKGEYTL